MRWDESQICFASHVVLLWTSRDGVVNFKHSRRFSTGAIVMGTLKGQNSLLLESVDLLAKDKQFPELSFAVWQMTGDYRMQGGTNLACASPEGTTIPSSLSQ